MNKIITLLILIFPFFTYSQSSNSISGQAIVLVDSLGISGVNVTLRPQDTVRNALHTITNYNGKFSFAGLSAGNYILKLKHNNYEEFELNLSLSQKDLDLGVLPMTRNIDILPEVIVEGENPRIKYRVDRKVIQASGLKGAQSISDVLRNIPSVDVDIDGNVKFRGGGVFKVLIDGKPERNASEKLKSMPLERIERIEVITNPSAEFSAEGTAGILQIVLKKNLLEGYSINSNIYSSTLGDLTGYLSIDKKTENIRLYGNISLGKSYWYKSSNNRYQQFEKRDTLYTLNSDFNNTNSLERFSVEIGSTFELNKKNTLDISIDFEPIKRNAFDENYGQVISMEVPNSLNNTSYYLDSKKHTSSSSYNASINYTSHINQEEEEYFRAFLNVGGLLSPREVNLVDLRNYPSSGSNIKSGLSVSERKMISLNGRLTYQKEFSNNSRINTGLEIDIDSRPGILFINSFPPQINLTNKQEVNYKRTNTSGFMNYKFDYDNLSIQTGVRLEHTSTEFDLYLTEDERSHAQSYKKTNARLFPNIYLLYNWDESRQFYVNYSRRISRPSLLQIVPLNQYENFSTISSGNSDLIPTTIHSYEAGFIKNYGSSNFLNLGLFHQRYFNSLESYSNGGIREILLQKVMNVGNTYNTGGELSGNFSVTDFWDISPSVSAFHSEIHVMPDGENYYREHFNYNIRINNTLEFKNNFSLIYNMSYMGPQKTSQQYREGYFFATGSIRKSWKNFIFTVSSNNLFNTLKFDFSMDEPNFNYRDLTVLKQFLAFKVAYRFNNQ